MLLFLNLTIYKKVESFHCSFEFNCLHCYSQLWSVGGTLAFVDQLPGITKLVPEDRMFEFLWFHKSSQEKNLPLKKHFLTCFIALTFSIYSTSHLPSPEWFDSMSQTLTFLPPNISECISWGHSTATILLTYQRIIL